jgi:limonene-1,2-epoxide hydrolase
MTTCAESGFKDGVGPEQVFTDVRDRPWPRCLSQGVHANPAVFHQNDADARYHVFAWEEPFVGREAIGAELLRQARLFSDGEFEILNVASVGRTVFVQRHDIVTMFGKRATMTVVGVFELDADAKITSWRDYLDSREIGVKVGQDAPDGTAASETGEPPN